MESKKKLLISVCSLCLVAVAAIVGVVAVWAFSNQTVTSNISVTYVARQVAGSVSANYTVGSTTKNMTIDGTADGAASLTYTGSETSNTQGVLKPQGNIELDATNTYVVFEYVFTNSSTTTAYPIQLTYTDDATADSNMGVYVISTGAKIESSNYASTSWGDKVTGSTLVENTVKVPASSTGYYVYVKVAVQDIASDASFSGAYGWTLGTVSAN